MEKQNCIQCPVCMYFCPLYLSLLIYSL
ncbi:hypothetical protein D7X25_17335 [bacterium 1XD42-8]|nr:hypothetical protein D7X25_17335 [bacterium 1XD42-8]